MDLRTATRMEKNRRQAIAISVFMVVLMLGVATSFIALSFVNPNSKGNYITGDDNVPIGGPNQPVVTASWVMPVANDAATILKTADFNLPQKNATQSWWEYDLGYTIGAAADTAVVACYDGKVISVADGNGDETGKLVRIQHANGLETVYGSLGSITVKVGDTVKSGDKIGTVGNTSAYEKFEMPHVRLTAYQNGVAVNPEQFVEFPNNDDK